MPFGTEKYFSCYFIWINEARLVPARRAEIVTQDEYEDATAHSGKGKRGRYLEFSSTTGSMGSPKKRVSRVKFFRASFGYP